MEWKEKGKWGKLKKEEIHYPDGVWSSQGGISYSEPRRKPYEPLCPQWAHRRHRSLSKHVLCTFLPTTMSLLLPLPSSTTGSFITAVGSKLYSGNGSIFSVSTSSTLPTIETNRNRLEWESCESCSWSAVLAPGKFVRSFIIYNILYTWFINYKIINGYLAYNLICLFFIIYCLIKLLIIVY